MEYFQQSYTNSCPSSEVALQCHPLTLHTQWAELTVLSTSPRTYSVTQFNEQTREILQNFLPEQVEDHARFITITIPQHGFLSVT